VANVGDSRVILGRTSGKPGARGWVAVPVSDDHKPDRPDEQKRILARGGRVFAVEYEDGIDGPPRVWLGHMDIPGLAMSRSVGDTVAHTAGVISDPEMTTVDLVPEDKVIVWASDGLWEFMSNQEVRYEPLVWCPGQSGRAGPLHRSAFRANVLMSLPLIAPQVIDMIQGISDPRKAVDVLVEEANKRWMKEEQVIDDTTIIVVYLDVPA